MDRGAAGEIVPGDFGRLQEVFHASREVRRSRCLFRRRVLEDVPHLGVLWLGPREEGEKGGSGVLW